MSTAFTFRSPLKLSDTTLTVTTTKTAGPVSRTTSVFESESFTFIVGEESKKFVLPSQLVAFTSKVLDRMINGSMRESRDKYVVLKDVDKDTFIRFCEYLYTGRYHDPALVESPTENTKDSSRLGSLDSSFSVPATRTDLIVSHTSILKTDQKSLDSEKNKHNFAHLTIGPRQLKPRLIIKDQASSDDIEVLTAHINVYVFAHKYDLAELSIISWKKIHGALTTSLDQKNLSLGDTVNLIEIVYSQTAARSSTPGEPLRKLVAAFAALKVQLLLKTPQFKQLADSCPEVHFDILEEITAMNSE